MIFLNNKFNKVIIYTILLISMMFILTSCNKNSNKSKENIDDPLYKHSLETENIYASIPGCENADLNYEFDEIDKLMLLKDKENSKDSYVWKDVMLDNIKGTAIVQIDSVKKITSIEYAFSNNKNNREGLLRYLINHYGTSSAIDDSSKIFSWIVRLSNEESFDMNLEFASKTIKLQMKRIGLNRNEQWGYQIPDMYNTGVTCDKEGLQEFRDKYPECVLPDGRTVITESTAKKNNYKFEKFKSEQSIIFTQLQHNVVIEDFYISANIKIDYRNNKDGVIVSAKNGEIEKGFVRACNMVLDKVYMHDSECDFINALYNVTIRDCYFRDGGTKEGAHADGIQLAGYDNIDAYNINMENVRIDMVHIPKEHVSNACIMIQPDYGAVKDVNINHCYLNGGGYTIYSYPKKNTIENVCFYDTVLGAGCRFGIYYGDSKNNMKETNTKFADRSYIGGIVIENNTINFYANNYSEKEQNIKCVVKKLENGVFIEKESISNYINGYTTWKNSIGIGNNVAQPVNIKYNLDTKIEKEDIVQLVFYNNNNIIGSYCILK